MKNPYFLLALLVNVLSANAGDIVLPAVSASIKFTNPVVSSNMSFGIETNASGEGYTGITTIDGIPCRKIPAGKFMYVNCNRTAVPTTAKKIILSITYYGMQPVRCSAMVLLSTAALPLIGFRCRIMQSPYRG